METGTIHLPIILSIRNPQNAHKNTEKSSKNFKPSIHNATSTGTNFAENMTFYLLKGYVRFARYCVKM